MKSSKVKTKRCAKSGKPMSECMGCRADAEKEIIWAANKWRTNIWNDDYARKLIQSVDWLNKLRGSK